MSILEKRNPKNTKSKVGAAIKRGLTKTSDFFLGGLEKEMKMQDAQNKKWEHEGKMSNAAYSGLPSNVKYKK